MVVSRPVDGVRFATPYPFSWEGRGLRVIRLLGGSYTRPSSLSYIVFHLGGGGGGGAGAKNI